MSKKESSKGKATLHLTITYDDSMVNIVDAAKEVVEKARELGYPEGFLEFHRMDTIDIGELG